MSIKRLNNTTEIYDYSSHTGRTLTPTYNIYDQSYNIFKAESTSLIKKLEEFHTPNINSPIKYSLQEQIDEFYSLYNNNSNKNQRCFNNQFFFYALQQDNILSFNSIFNNHFGYSSSIGYHTQLRDFSDPAKYSDYIYEALNSSNKYKNASCQHCHKKISKNMTKISYFLGQWFFICKKCFPIFEERLVQQFLPSREYLMSYFIPYNPRELIILLTPTGRFIIIDEIDTSSALHISLFNNYWFNLRLHMDRKMALLVGYRWLLLNINFSHNTYSIQRGFYSSNGMIKYYCPTNGTKKIIVNDKLNHLQLFTQERFKYHIEEILENYPSKEKTRNLIL